MSTAPHRWRFGLSAFVVLAVCAAASAQPPGASALGALSVWDDGLSEMCYYRATDVVYGEKRAYTRVHMVNRQWMSEATGVKTDAADALAVPVLKLNVAEEIPTENYNYRFLTTVFLHRGDLAPFKTVFTSQEWCGTTYKHLRWSKDELTVRSFSYFGDEGDREWRLPAETVPVESLFLLAREVVASGASRTLSILDPIRSNKQAAEKTNNGTLTPGSETDVTVALGTFVARRVDLVWDGPLTSFVVEARAPYRLLRFRAGPLRGELVAFERRAYWDRSWKSSAYEQSQAP